jgi:hypothetical protein
MSTAFGLLGSSSEQPHSSIGTTASDVHFMTTYCRADNGAPRIAARAIRDRRHRRSRACHLPPRFWRSCSPRRPPILHVEKPWTPKSVAFAPPHAIAVLPGEGGTLTLLPVAFWALRRLGGPGVLSVVVLTVAIYRILSPRSAMASDGIGGTVNGWLRAVGAKKQCAPSAPTRRFWSGPPTAALDVGGETFPSPSS